VGAASGRVDAVAFMAGMIAGVWVFAEAYVALADFLWSSEMGSTTLADTVGLPFWLLAVVLVAVALVVFWLIGRFERRLGGGA